MNQTVKCIRIYVCDSVYMYTFILTCIVTMEPRRVYTVIMILKLSLQGLILGNNGKQASTYSVADTRFRNTLIEAGLSLYF